MPKKVDPAHKRSEQILVRLTTDELEWLDSAAHLERVSVNTYIFDLVRAHVRTLSLNEHVQNDRENRRSYEAGLTQARSIQRPQLDVSFAPGDNTEATTAPAEASE